VGTIGDYRFDEDLVLVTEDETFYGRTKPIAYRVSGKCWVNNHAHVLRPVPPVDVDFLCYLLMHYPVWPWLSGTTGRAKLTQRALLSLPVPLPPRHEMLEIARQLSAAFSRMESLSVVLDSHVLRWDSLDESILGRALAGDF
jgi:type I restriction enzyme S subunit